MHLCNCLHNTLAILALQGPSIKLTSFQLAKTNNTNNILNTPTMPPFIINPQQMLRRGLRLVSIDRTKQDRRLTKTNLQDFMSIYGKHPLHLCRVWRNLQTHQHIAHPMAFDEARTKDAFEGFMIAQNFLRSYTTVVIQASLFKGADRARVGRLRWLYVRKLASLKPLKIVWPVDFETIYIGSVYSCPNKWTKRSWHAQESNKLQP